MHIITVNPVTIVIHTAHGIVVNTLHELHYLMHIPMLFIQFDIMLLWGLAELCNAIECLRYGGGCTCWKPGHQKLYSLW